MAGDNPAYDRVLARLRQLGWVSDKRKASFGPNDRIGMATAGQIALIRSLWLEVTKDGTDAALDKWLSRFGPSALRFVDDKTAPRIIAALRGWQGRLATKVARPAVNPDTCLLSPS